MRGPELSRAGPSCLERSRAVSSGLELSRGALLGRLPPLPAGASWYIARGRFRCRRTPSQPERREGWVGWRGMGGRGAEGSRPSCRVVPQVRLRGPSCSEPAAASHGARQRSEPAGRADERDNGRSEPTERGSGARQRGEATGPADGVSPRSEPAARPPRGRGRPMERAVGTSHRSEPAGSSQRSKRQHSEQTERAWSCGTAQRRRIGTAP